MPNELTTTNTNAPAIREIPVKQMEKLNPKRGLKLSSPALQSAYSQMCEAFDTAQREVNAAGNVALTARDKLVFAYEDILCGLPFTPKGKLDAEKMGGIKSVAEFAKTIEIPGSTAYALLSHGRMRRSDVPETVKAFTWSNWDVVKSVPVEAVVAAVNAGEISAATTQDKLKEWKTAYDEKHGKPKPAKVVTPVMLIRLKQEPTYDETGKPNYFDYSELSGLTATMDTAEAVLREHWFNVAKAPDFMIHGKGPDTVIKHKAFICSYARAKDCDTAYTLYIALPDKPKPKPEPLTGMEHRALDLRKTLEAANMAPEAVKAAVTAAFPTVDYDKLT